MKTFGLFVDRFEERPVTTTRILPELNWVDVVHDKEPSEFFGDGSQLNLGRVNGRVEYEFCCMDRVSNDNDFQYTK